MSDNLRRYRAIRQALKQGYPGEPSGRLAQHLTSLAAFIRVLSQSSIFGQNPKIEYQEFNDLQTPKLSEKQLCDRTP